MNGWHFFISGSEILKWLPCCFFICERNYPIYCLHVAAVLWRNKKYYDSVWSESTWILCIHVLWLLTILVERRARNCPTEDTLYKYIQTIYTSTVYLGGSLLLHINEKLTVRNGCDQEIYRGCTYILCEKAPINLISRIMSLHCILTFLIRKKTHRVICYIGRLCDLWWLFTLCWGALLNHRDRIWTY